MNSVQLPTSTQAPAPLADIHDRVMEAYYGKLGEHFMRETQSRIHWICAQVTGRRVLDVGCSQGIVPLLLAREGCEVTGVDTSPQAIEEAKRYLANEPAHVQEKICYVNADFLSLNTQDAEPDTIVISEVLEHLVRPELFVEKAAALLKPDGCLIITVPFGVNDFIDHKHTFYLLEPLRLLSKHLHITQVKVLGKWLGVVATKPHQTTAPAPLSLDLELIATLEKAFEAIERNLQNSLTSTSKNLAEANNKYRAATEQIAQLKPEAAKVKALEHTVRVQDAELAKQVELKSNLEEANSKYRAATEQIAQLRPEAAKVKALEHAISVQDAELAKQVELQSNLEEASKKYRAATEHNQQLKTRLSELEALKLSQHEQYQSELSDMRAWHAEAQTRLNVLNDEVQALNEHNLRLQEQIAEERAARHLAETERLNTAHQAEEQRHAQDALQVNLEKDIDSLLLQIDGLRAQYEQETLELDEELKSSRARIAELSEALEQERASRPLLESDLQLKAEHLDEREQTLNLVQRELAACKSWLEDANKKYREATGAQIPHLKSELSKLREQTAEQRRRIEALNDELRSSQAKRHHAEQRLIKTRSSITYQLGYQLKSSAGSFGGMIRLPSNLLNLYRQANKGRKNTPVPSIGVEAPVAALLPAPPAEPVLLPVILDDASHIRSSLLNDAQGSTNALKVACVMDEFTFGSYRNECNLLPLTPHDWQAELQQFQPELLFIESAWRGKDDLWGSKIGHNGQELQDILKWCNEHKVPTVFWNKEDPVHFETFLSTAKQFDFVFTTDIDCIHRYKGALGHERVYLLPFACQPAVHNPVELYERKDAFCFAGAYYARYPERTRDLASFVSELPRLRPLDIFDRNFGKDDKNYQFPGEYQPYIVGTLSFDQIDLAYKGYRYAINLNSIKQSQSMFARRIFELLGSNTVTVSNFSRGVRLLFGDLVITTDSGPEMLRRLNLHTSDERYSDKLRLAALRKVMQEHTYAHRMNYVISKVTGEQAADTLPRLCVVARADSVTQLVALNQHCLRQRHPDFTLHVVADEQVQRTAPACDPRLHFITPAQAATVTLQALATNAAWVATMVADDYYGPNYLLDLALATRYSQAQVIGKTAHFAQTPDGIHLTNPGQAYRRPAHIAVRAALIHGDLIADQRVNDWLEHAPSLEYAHEQCLAIDAFNYCKQAAGADVSAVVDDLALDSGISIDELQRRAEAITPLEASHTSPEICGSQLAALFEPMRSKHLTETVEGREWQITSTLEDGKHEYHYAKQELTIDVLGGGEKVKLYLDATPGLNIQWVVLFLDAQKQRISHVMQHANRNHTFDVPPEAAFVRLGVRVYANGSADIKALVLGHRDLQPSEMLGKSEHLLITNHYPAYDDLYRNGFVHTRVAAYKEQGVNVDVFRLRNNESVNYHEFENIDVITGSQATLAKMLESGAYRSVLVHFLDPAMWEVLRKHLDHITLTVWVHGAEIQPWWRREYNYNTEEQRALGKLDSEKRMSFWRELLQPMPANLKLVFVSRYFAEEVMEDLGFRLPESQYEIIHNPINTELFSYEEKPVEQRKKILSIRPYASRTYANDLSVKAIQLLAQKPWFKELEILMVGDGPLFDETLAPLRQYPNVRIQRGYLSQAQIAKLHKEFGIFLCPSRMDTQGVSRDEAMASGLVPVTSAVGAIAEFVDSGCGYLCEPESFTGLSDAIESLFLDTTLFAQQSVNARQRVVQQSEKKHISTAELALFSKMSRHE